MFHPFDDIKQLDLDKFEMVPLLHKVMENGQRIGERGTWQDARAYHLEQLEKLPQEYKRFDFPHIYKIGISEKLKAERTRLIEEHISMK